MSKREVIIAGNWKMNFTNSEAKAFIEKLAVNIGDSSCNVVLAAPFTLLSVAKEAAKDTGINISSQNCHWEQSGAFTGEVSAPMLKDIGVEYTLIGHSERRAYFGESDSTVNLRTKASLASGIRPIVCIGETLEEREQELTEQVLKRQIDEGLCGIQSDLAKNIIVAYEPVWAIGTGKTATGEMAEEACAYVRNCLKSLFTEEVSEKMPILYGGSMNEKNCDELLSKENIDGGLIGGASLKCDIFTEMVKIGEMH